MTIIAFHPSLFQTIPGFISCKRMIGKMGTVSHAKNSVMWLVLSERSVKAVRNHIIIIVIFANVQTCVCTHEYLKIPKVLIMIGVSLSEPHMYMTALHKSVSMVVGLLVWTNHLLYT